MIKFICNVLVALAVCSELWHSWARLCGCSGALAVPAGRAAGAQGVVCEGSQYPGLCVGQEEDEEGIQARFGKCSWEWLWAGGW